MSKTVSIDEQRLSIPGRNMGLFLNRVNRLNANSVDGSGVNVSFDKIRTGEDDELFYDVTVRGHIQYGKVQPVASIQLTENGGSIVRPFLGANLSAAEIAYLGDEYTNGSERHDAGKCDCCGSKKGGQTARDEVLVFRCLEPMEFDRRDPNKKASSKAYHKSFGEGDLIWVGGNCKDSFNEEAAVSFLRDLERIEDTDMPNGSRVAYSRDNSIDPYEYLKHVLAVGYTHIDDVMTAMKPVMRYGYIARHDILSCSEKPFSARTISLDKDTGSVKNSPIRDCALALYRNTFHNDYGAFSKWSSRLDASSVVAFRSTPLYKDAKGNALSFDQLVGVTPSPEGCDLPKKLAQVAHNILNENYSDFYQDELQKTVFDKNRQALSSVASFKNAGKCQMLCDYADVHYLSKYGSPMLHQRVVNEVDTVDRGDYSPYLKDVPDTCWFRTRDMADGSVTYDVKVIVNEGTVTENVAVSSNNRALCSHRLTAVELTDLACQKPIIFESEGRLHAVKMQRMRMAAKRVQLSDGSSDYKVTPTLDGAKESDPMFLCVMPLEQARQERRNSLQGVCRNDRCVFMGEIKSPSDGVKPVVERTGVLPSYLPKTGRDFTDAVLDNPLYKDLFKNTEISIDEQAEV